MKKVLIFTSALLLMISSSVVATDTRALTMGDNNLVLLDDANIWLFPSRVFEYSNIAVGEFSDEAGNDFTKFGIHWKFGTDNPMVFGTYFTDLPADQPSNLNSGDLVPFDNALPDNRRIDFFYGNELGDIKFGSRFSVFCSGQEWDEVLPDTILSEESYRYYDFDFGMTPSSGSWDLAMKVAFGSWTDKGDDGLAETEPDGFTDISALGRYFWQRGPDYTFIPHLQFFHLKRGIINHVVDDDPTTTEDLIDNYTRTGFNLGVGTNYTPASNVLAVCDLGFLYEKWTHERENNLDTTSGEVTASWTALPYIKIGLDADVFKWMDIRLGATSYWSREATEDKGANNEFWSRSADNETYIGFGFHWGRLQVDTYTDPELFLNGFDFISGGGAGNMNFQISAVYEMM